MNLLKVVSDFFLHHFPQQESKKTYWLAYSGGLDSQVLLHLCYQLRSELSLSLQAIHVNHGLSPHANEWALHCARVCNTYDIPFHECKVKVLCETGDSLEACARHARYAAFAACMKKGDVLLSAHHQDDQAETVLLQLMRGSGLKGLAAMPLIKAFAQGIQARPLLSFSRALLKQYAISNQLTWIEDESNQSMQLSRNFIRHQVLPLLTSRWPNATTTIARSAMHCAEADHLLADVLDEMYCAAIGSRVSTLSVSKLLAHSVSEQRWILRHWIKQQGFALPNSKKIMNILQEALTARADRLPCVAWEGGEVRRYRDDLYIMANLVKHDVRETHQWTISQPLILPGLGTLAANTVVGSGLSLEVQQVKVAYRQGGEKVTNSQQLRRTLKNLFYEWQVLPWERDRIPLLFYEAQLISVVGYYIDNSYAAKAQEGGWKIELVAGSPLSRG